MSTTRRLASLHCLRWVESHEAHRRLLRVFTTSPPHPYVRPVPLQTGEVVTRVAPSQRIPGLRGVYLTKAVKKFHPIEVLPTAAAATATALTSSASASQGPYASSCSSSSSTRAAAVEDTTTLGSGRPADAVTLAPPLVLNLAFAPRHHISLRRFLALRHMFSSSAYLQVATERGWYLIEPSSAAPLCADLAGLQRWVRVHHRRYLEHRSASSSSSCFVHKDKIKTGKGSVAAVEQARVSSPKDARRAELATWEAALDNGAELTAAQLRALADKERKASAEQENEDGNDDDDDTGDDELGGDGSANVHGSSALQEEESHAAAGDAAFGSATATTRAAAASAPQLKIVPPLITEAHLFEINDGVVWELPASDDLANHDYWKDHRQRMTLYESTGDADAAEQREALLRTIRSDPRAQTCTEQQLYAAAEALFQTLKQKANVKLSVDDESGLLSLVPLVDLAAGEELFLHYGREWWTGRLLSSLLLAVSDEEMPRIRWIEQLFGHSTDRNERFPLLIPAHKQRRYTKNAAAPPPSARRSKRHNRGANKDHTRDGGEVEAAVDDNSRASCASSSSAPAIQHGPLVLYNTVTRGKATDAAVLAYAIRRSCVEQAFFDRLVLGDPARGVPPVFRASAPDAEVPMRVVRKALLASLRGVREGGGGEALAAGLSGGAGDSAAAKLPERDAVSGQRSRLSEHDEDDGNDVFSV
ncbi:hypothetical protein ABB37_06411 [Leptomonas pyrrhocoris]|uniref:SET domain-containing protein n=1 Tax=Leptomonas pyrrhocoris TaxID=157538 RepID=A0A0M9FXQ6_LEPPY|nr:hypothetical protein ABB37_06411 [Leptomonas pyrrhocoris]KPA78260.1 hypothetical protein ABB37_06411 [Leptomonas pyrrhocoris]|eukprot:XP_015656699.1 hypothetical protein ABB37_06411 [Leptomonas pyrrhocoris]